MLQRLKKHLDMELFRSLKDYRREDTIAAIATYPAKSALGVIKISGSKALEIISKIFLPAKKKDIRKVKSYTLHYGWIVNSSKKEEIIDEVLVSIMRAPFSYTREDVVEISSHGGILVLNKILELVLQEGARLAKPGEFSWRAFINGRIDLLQAQSILDIVEAKTEKALFGALRQLKGEVSSFFNNLKEKIKDIYSQIQAVIEFPEEEIEIDLKKIKRELEEIKKEIEKIKKSFYWARLLREGINCVICGRTNVGKSTLFNSLLEEDIALVTKIAGTTRDIIGKSINIEGIPLNIYDTAGILKTKSLIDKKAMKRSLKKVEEADLILFVFDYSRRLSKEDFSLLEKVKNKKVIYVINKIDLEKRIDLRRINNFKPQIKVSALKKIGLDRLRREIASLIKEKGVERENMIFLTQWQKEVIEKVDKKIKESFKYLDGNYSIDFVNFALREIIDELEKLVGVSLEEEALKEIFSKFCIGK